MTFYMGTYQNYQTRSRAGGLSWRDTALGLLNFWPATSSHGKLGTRSTDSWEANGGGPKQSYPSTLIRDDGTKTKKELRTLMRAGTYMESDICNKSDLVPT